MKKVIIKYTVFLIVFLAALVTISHFMNRGNENLTMEMAPATLPVVTMEMEGIAYNQLHGHLEAVDTAYQRETVTALGENREAAFVVDTYGMPLNGISIEVRDMSGGRLIENTAVTDVQAADREGSLRCSIALKDLIEKDQEYMLVILLDTQEQGLVRYYTRVLWSEDTYPLEKLRFAEMFHETLYDRERAKEENIVQYLESNSSGDNTTYHKVNIHSSFNQITWGDLNVTEVTEPVLQLTELGTQTGSMVLHYIVSTAEEDIITYYMVTEAYRVRFLTNAERMYLLGFERTMTQIPDAEGQMYANDKILLGIVDEDQPFVESKDGNVILFEVAGQLCSYNVTTNRMTVLFSFYDGENADARTLYDAHDIKILDVDEGGDVYFAVYGYMNRGRHEGKVGIALYHYDNSLNTVEEIVYIPSSKSYDVLARDVEQLMYLNRENHLYVHLDNIVYRIDVAARTYEELLTITQEDSMMASADQKVLVWQTGSDSYHGSSLAVMNLVNDTIHEIPAGDGNAIKLLGFIGEDIIYGLAKLEDITEDAMGRTFFPMYRICISDAEGGLLKETGQEGIYTVNCTVEGRQITLDRVIRTGTGIYEEALQDYIMTSEQPAVGKNVLAVAVTETYKKYVQIQTRKGINAKKLQVRKPKEVVFEGGRELSLVPTQKVERYYAYDMYGAAGAYLDPSRAISHAYGQYGVVTDDDGRRIWRRGNLVTRNQIMAITSQKADETRSSLAVCLDTMLQKEGITRFTQPMLDQRMDIRTILEENLPQGKILGLNGISLDALLYYVNQDIPLLALLQNGEAILITGFNEYNVVVMDPVAGTLQKEGIRDTTKWLEENGSHFFTYVYE